ncbi:hypothetical protein [Sphingomonas phage Kimi]|nr:hypothetical protein [Sphingomonas phage Kimi]
MTHELKVITRFWEDLEAGRKNFELRRNDRHYRVGDTLKLKEFNHDHGFTGRTLLFDVTYMLLPEDIPGIQTGWCIMGIKPHG